MPIRLTLAVVATGVLAACDTSAPLPTRSEGGGASLHIFLYDSAGAYRASAITDAFWLEPGDSVATPASLFVLDEGDTEMEYEGSLTGACRVEGTLAYVLTTDAGVEWRLDSRCDAHPTPDSWLRVDDGVVTKGGVFDIGYAVP